MAWRRTVSILLFLAAFVTWCGLAYEFAPPHFGYRALFLATGGGLLLFTYWYPAGGLWLFLALTPLSNLPSRAFILGAHEALVFLALAFTLGWWAHNLVVRLPTGLDRRLLVPLLLVIGLGTTSGAWTALRYSGMYPVMAATFRNAWVNLAGMHADEAVRRSLLALAVYLVFPCVFWAAYSIMRRTMLTRHTHEVPWRGVVLTWTGALVPVLLVAFYQREINPTFCMLDEPAWREAQRVSGGMTDPNALGLFLALYLPLAAVAAWKERGLRQMALLVCGLAGVAALTFSGSRSALLGLALTAAMAAIGLGVALLRARAGRARVAGVLGAFVLICVVAVTLLPIWQDTSTGTAGNPLFARLEMFMQRLHTTTGHSVVDRREKQWKQAGAMWRDYPFAGIGLGAFALEVPNYNRAAREETPIDNAWNQYLQWLSELGAAGLFCWIWCYVAYIGLVVRAMRRNGLRHVTVPVAVILGVLASLQALFVFGAHLHSAEVAVASAVLAALALAHFSLHERGDSRMPAREIGIVVLAGLIIVAAQGQNALGPLSQRAVQKRYALPTEFGLYHVEHWQKLFTYQWTERFAGKDINVPSRRRVLVLRMAAMDPELSPLRPKLVKVWLDDLYLDTVRIESRDWQEHELYVYDVPSGAATLILECDRTWTPESTRDPRRLGVALATEIEWRDVLTDGAQGLTEWEACVHNGDTNRVRWMRSHAALTVVPAEEGRITVSLYAPADVPFYRRSATAMIRYNNVPVLTLPLPRRKGARVTESYTLERRLRGTPGILSIAVDRLSSARRPGTIKRVRYGAGVGPVHTR